ncbi:hypothetical protein ACFY1L_42165 [Streptomyces sp. NPDC001663]|uniref:hypothetical protein n=1 Tax=Streptomyces sp. NPDC001663 TaxID=3364597 RepID=UPI0036A051A4
MTAALELVAAPADDVPLSPSGPRRRAPSRFRSHRVPLATLTMLPLYLVWAIFRANGGGDLAPQETWARFAAQHGDSAYGLFWYGGVHTMNYSVISPYLMGALGVRTVAVASGLAAGWLAAVLLVRTAIRRPLWPALLAAFGLWVNVAAGRVTFALGVAFAGLFLVVAGAAYWLVRDWARGAALMLQPFAVVATTTLLFPFHGQEPMAAGRILWPGLLGLAVAALTPRDWRVVRWAGAVYAAGVLLSYVIASPIGANVERLALLFAPAVLLAALLETPGCLRRLRGALAVALAASLVWLGSGTPTSFLRGSGQVPAWAADTHGVVRALDRLGANDARVEAVPTQDHREAAVLAPHVNLARGWNTQLDMERGRLFCDGTFSPTKYRAWLDRWAVGFVVLPDAEPDRYGEAEARLVRSRPAWLEPVWSDAHWKVYRVRNAVPLVSAPATVVHTSDDALEIRMPRRGSVSVRVAYSPWLHAEGGCLSRQGQFTRLTVNGPDVYRISSEYLPGYGASPASSARLGC